MEAEPPNEPSESTAAKGIQWDSNRITGIAAIFISILSMIAVIYQSYLAREENDLIRIQQSASVLPYITSWSSDIEGEFKFVIGNKGVGPAFIKDVRISLIDSQSKDSIIFNNSDHLIAYMEARSNLLDTTPGYTGTFRPNMLLSQGEVKEIFVYQHNNRDQAQLLRSAIGSFGVTFSITYEDVYGAVWIYNSNDNAPRKIE